MDVSNAVPSALRTRKQALCHSTSRIDLVFVYNK